MSMSGSNISANIRIQRFNPDKHRKPFLQTFELQLGPETTILDALERIKAEDDGTLTFRRSCRHAICGSCAMNVNGRNMLICNRRVMELLEKRRGLDRRGRLTIRPLPYLPIIKDLVVDRSSFWEQYQRIKPWLIPPADFPETEFRVSPIEVKALNDAEKCIMCGACYSACQIVALNKQYLGPHALLKGSVRVLDPRDSGVEERLREISEDDGVFRCHSIFNCIDACPKGLNPTQAIETLRKLAKKRAAIVEERQERQMALDKPIQPHSAP